ncbi:MAG: hypothetical protein GY869_31735 [Planctomycetes bacterium]|nr:hypothetical protein [Planctomycetota bacterium]
MGLGEYKRVIGVGQVLYLVGRTLKRQCIKYTVAAALIAVAAMFADTIGSLFGYAILEQRFSAMFLPALVALATFGVGNVLIAVSNLFSAEKMLFADANAMNLMEDRKKVDSDEHLRHFWERVFKQEAELQQQVKKSDLSPYRHENDIRFPSSCEEFVKSAGHSLRHHLPQKLEKSITGCNLSLVEDWYDGAYFTLNDCKLKEQYAAHQSIRGIRLIVGLTAWTRIREALTGYPDPVWYNLTMKKIGAQVGAMIEKMNNKHVKSTEPKYFDAQDFLWKHPEVDELICQHFPDHHAEVKEDLYNTRKKIMRSIFSDNSEDAHRQIFRMFGRDFVNALKLRLGYDVEFAGSLLDYTPLSDVTEMNRLTGFKTYPAEKLRLKMKAGQDSITLLDDFFERYMPEVRGWPYTLRAGRIGFHTDWFNIQKMVRERPEEALEVFKSQILPAQNRFSQRICLLRQHYELSRIQLFSYTQMVDELADYFPAVPKQEKS